MYEIEPLEKTISLCLQSAYVKNNTKPVSMLIVAKAEHGKTQALMNESGELIKQKRVFFTNNITAKYIEKSLLPDINEGKIRHIIIPDILNAIERGRSTRKLFVNFFKSLIEEGIVNLADAYGSFSSPHPVKCGLITAITKDSLTDNYLEWKNIGFLSRVIMFSYCYDDAKVLDILEKYAENKLRSNNSQIITEEKIIQDPINDPTYQKFIAIALSTAREDYDGIGVRFLDNLKGLARANAMMRGSEIVEEQDITEVLRLNRWFNAKYNPL